MKFRILAYRRHELVQPGIAELAKCIERISLLSRIIAIHFQNGTVRPLLHQLQILYFASKNGNLFKGWRKVQKQYHILAAKHNKVLI